MLKTSKKYYVHYEKAQVNLIVNLKEGPTVYIIYVFSLRKPTKKNITTKKVLASAF